MHAGGMIGGMHGGGMQFGGMNGGTHFGGARFASAPFAHGSFSPRSHFGFRGHGFHDRFAFRDHGFHHRFAFRNHRFHHRFRSFAFIGGPFAYAAYDGCWRRSRTPYGWQWVNLCGYDYY